MVSTSGWKSLTSHHSLGSLRELGGGETGLSLCVLAAAEVLVEVVVEVVPIALAAVEAHAAELALELEALEDVGLRLLVDSVEGGGVRVGGVDLQAERGEVVEGGALVGGVSLDADEVTYLSALRLIERVKRL